MPDERRALPSSAREEGEERQGILDRKSVEKKVRRRTQRKVRVEKGTGFALLKTLPPDWGEEINVTSGAKGLKL